MFLRFGWIAAAAAFSAACDGRAIVIGERTDAVDASDGTAPPTFGAPVAVRTGLNHPVWLSADATGIYWLEGDNSLLSAAPSGDGVAKNLAMSLSDPRALNPAKSTLFFSANDGSVSWVMEVSKGGGPVAKRVQHAFISGITALSIEGNAMAFVAKGTVMRAGTDGSGAAQVAPGQPETTRVLLRAPYVYWNGVAGILRHNGGAAQAPEVFSSAGAGTAEIVGDADSLYWATMDGVLHALRFDQAGAVPRKVAEGLKSPRGFSLDDTHVYYATPTTGEVFAVPKGGGIPMAIAKGQPDPGWTAANVGQVFFTNARAGTIVRVPKSASGLAAP